MEEIAGEKNGRKFFMVVATIFIFVIMNNWFGLLPFFNAIGKTEDVNHHIFEEIAEHAEDGKPFEEARAPRRLADGERGGMARMPQRR